MYYSSDYHRGLVLQQLRYEGEGELKWLSQRIWDDHTAKNAVTMAGHIPLADVPAYYTKSIEEYDGKDSSEIIRVYRIAKERLRRYLRLYLNVSCAS